MSRKKLHIKIGELHPWPLGLIICLLILFPIIFNGCKKPYNPIVAVNNLNILVVEGTINTGAVDSTIIKLSRTGVVNNKTGANPETGATVTIENAQSTVLSLTEKARGTYAAPPANLDNAKQYRLRIKTANGKVYLSDLVDVKVTPPIDSVGYTLTSHGVQIYANTHDPANSTHYYKYNYGETWQFNAEYESNYIFSYQDTDLVLRTPAQKVQYCFGADSSSHTIINSTASLSQDIAYHVPITTVEDTSEKVETKYSILVTQQALTKEAYAFWENIQKNTEQLGSIFDAQPSQLIGNIHNIADSSEPVIGYISAGTRQQKRIYIAKSALPLSPRSGYLNACTLDTAYYYPGHKKLINKLHPPDNLDLSAHLYWVELALFPNFNEMLYQGRPYGLAVEAFKDTVGYKFSTTRCTDCTLRGTTKHPAFWK